MSDLFSLAGKTALVTGASRGIGRELARALAAAGAHVVLNGRHPDTLAPVVEELAADGHSVSASAFDVTDESAIAQAMESLAAERGGLDILVANAGVTHRAPLEEFGTQEWNTVIATNLTACFVMARLSAPYLRARGGGRIIFTGSMLGRIGRAAIPAYVASKHGIEGLAKTLAIELGPDGTTCNVLAPGYIETEFTRVLMDVPDFDRMVRQRTPVGRWGQPDDLAGPVVFLASAASRFVNGQVLYVDGGMSTSLITEDPSAG